MNTKTILTAALLAVPFATAHAIDNPSGPYVGGGWGRFHLDIDGADDLGSGLQAAVKDNDNSYKFFAGWRFSPYVALEAAYVNLGKPGDNISSGGSSGNYRVKADGFSPSLIGTLPVGPVELFGKVGYYFYDVDARLNLSGGQVFSGSSSGDDFVYGGGVGITFLERLHLRAEYEHFDLKNIDSSDAVWLSAAWRF